MEVEDISLLIENTFGSRTSIWDWQSAWMAYIIIFQSIDSAICGLLPSRYSSLDNFKASVDLGRLMFKNSFGVIAAEKQLKTKKTYALRFTSYPIKPCKRLALWSQYAFINPNMTNNLIRNAIITLTFLKNLHSNYWAFLDRKIYQDPTADSVILLWAF